MRKTLLIVLALLGTQAGKAQITLQHTFTTLDGGGYINNFTVVNLSNSGKKIMVVTSAYTLTFYNLDYSVWKTINIPPDPRFPAFQANLSFGAPNTGGNIFYASETLFNNDPLLEVAVFMDTATSLLGTIFIVNESGVKVDSIGPVLASGGIPELAPFLVFNTAPNTFVAAVQNTRTTCSFYSLPGTLPCDACGNGLGLAQVKTTINPISDAVPNPSSNKVKITFTLPTDAQQGEIDIYNSDGKKLKSYTVDHTFGYITVDDADFPPGIYFYNLTANGVLSQTKKMLVIK